MSTLKIAFYVGRGEWVDKLIRWKTNRRESHVELVFPSGECFSSSPRDGGVRFKEIQFNENWEFEEFEVSDTVLECLYSFCRGRCGRKYDFIGAIFGGGFDLNINEKSKDFCVESVGCALKFVGLLDHIDFVTDDVGEFREIVRDASMF